jgi:large subunit ribosomal protein L15
MLRLPRLWRAAGAQPRRLLAAPASAFGALLARPVPLHAACALSPLSRALRFSAPAASPLDERRSVGELSLNNLAPNPGAHKLGRRVGRGRGGGRGKTSGRGHKGAGARKGNKIPYAGFAGGQVPLHRRIPKSGFKNTRFERVYAELNLETLAQMLCTNRLQYSPERELTLKDLSDSGAVSISM